MGTLSKTKNRPNGKWQSKSLEFKPTVLELQDSFVLKMNILSISNNVELDDVSIPNCSFGKLSQFWEFRPTFEHKNHKYLRFLECMSHIAKWVNIRPNKTITWYVFLKFYKKNPESFFKINKTILTNTKTF